ncbi:MAG: hypothetical protein IJ345_07665 [Clostridia bacterium]|nr:hypothetical protein [Clostridia bacterium]
MKRYKATYCISILFFLADFTIIIIPSAIPFGIRIANDGRYAFWSVLLVFVAGAFALMLVALLSAFLINPLLKLIVSNEAFIYQNEISYNGRRLNIEDIKYVTLYFPTVISRTSGNPQMLGLWVDDDNSIVIKRPSLTLIAALKKKCTNAKFTIDADELKSRIKNDIITSLCLAIVVTVLIFFFEW